MAYEKRDNSGSLFRNDKKETDAHPDYTGSATIEGKDFWLSAWMKTSESGRRWMSFSFKPKEAKPAPKREPARRFDPDRDVPF